MKPAGRFPAATCIRTVLSVVIAVVGFTATTLLPQDSLDALRQAAEQGDAAAQFNLGVMYDIGRGVPMDKAEGARWMQKATERVDAAAQFNLGVLYGKGKGVGQEVEPERSPLGTHSGAEDINPLVHHHPVADRASQTIMSHSRKPLHKLSIREIRWRLTEGAERTDFSYNGLLAEWDRRQAAWLADKFQRPGRMAETMHRR